ncbi:MAG: hypothetical protein M9921_00510 [Fimbriimonadaceae bacterium]|nr:hypothetical protein [Chthonomonadaceae bacterium]MCO5295315.1 hypothetical protein [Fimbriimonadaceae bacterium]
MKIAPDVDQLMWVLAEQNDRKAVEEFEQRFPDLRLELAKRVALVNNLRGAGRAVQTDTPRFHAPAATPPRWNRPLAAAMLAACLCALAFGTFYATRALMPAPQHNAPPAQAGGAGAGAGAPVPKKAPDAGGQVPTTTVPNVAPPPIEPPAYVPKYQRRHTIMIDEAGLLTVLEAIATQTGMQVEVAPGLEDVKISCDYRDATGMEMLQDLGTKFGFTALSQGGNRVLIVPATDSRDGGPTGPMVPPTKDGN